MGPWTGRPPKDKTVVIQDGQELEVRDRVMTDTFLSRCLSDQVFTQTQLIFVE